MTNKSELIRRASELDKVDADTLELRDKFYEAIHLIRDLRDALAGDGWQSMDNAPRDTPIHTYGYLLRYGDEDHKGSDIAHYEDYISSSTVYPLRRTDFNNDGDTYVRTHWHTLIAPPQLKQEE